jgi:hypothetical protein
MKNIFLTLILATFAVTAQAGDLKKNFAQILATTKGPFELNYLQGTRSRVAVKNGTSLPGGALFQAAYRNDIARKMIAEDNFYLGNLFTTNYYELMGEYVYGNPMSNHELDHKRLADMGAKAMPKAAAMVRSWVLEKQYISQFPQSQMGKAYAYRGISDLVNEQTFAQYFFNFYVSSLTEDFQYLPAFILVNKSPIVASASLERARDLIAQAFDYYNGGGSTGDISTPSGRVTVGFFDNIFGNNNGGSNSGGGFNGGGILADQNSLTDMYKLRNNIHNQLNKEVVAQLDQFLKTYPQYQNDAYFPQLRAILVEYFGISVGKISATAQKLGFAEMKAAADQMANKKTYTDGLLALSRAAANLRANIATDKVPYEKRGLTLAMLAETTKVLNKEISSLKAETVKGLSNKMAEAIVNTVYVEGFLIKDNWTYFQKEATTTADAAQLLSDIVDASTATLTEAFRPSYEQWTSIEPKMSYFMDSTIKSSALNTASNVIEKLRRK